MSTKNYIKKYKVIYIIYTYTYFNTHIYNAVMLRACAKVDNSVDKQILEK